MRGENCQKLIAHLEKYGKDRSWKKFTELYNPGKSEDWARKIGRDFKLLNAKAPGAIPETAVKDDSKFVKEKIRSLFKSRQSKTFDEISDAIDYSMSRTKAIIKEMIDEGYTLNIQQGGVFQSSTIPKGDPLQLSIGKMSTGFHRFGACGDNHMCSKYERLDVLNALYDQYEEDGITTVFNTGNWIEGEARFNKHEINQVGMTNQLNYFIENYPQRKGITTYYIGGDDHEGWYVQREGLDIGKVAQLMARDKGREDLVYLGYMEADVEFAAPNGKTVVRLVHPGGGSAYAISYTSQKIVESLQGGDKPHVMLVGHFHKAEYLFNRGVHIVQTGTTQDQSTFMRKKRLAAHLGGWEIEMATDDNGAITRFKQEFFPFYDRAYYKKWAYKWG